MRVSGGELRLSSSTNDFFVSVTNVAVSGGPSDATVLPQLTGTGVVDVRKSGLGMILTVR